MYACTNTQAPYHMYVQVQSLYLGTCHDLARFDTPRKPRPDPFSFFPLPQKTNSMLGKRLVTHVARFDLFITYEKGNIVKISPPKRLKYREAERTEISVPLRPSHAIQDIPEKKGKTTYENLNPPQINSHAIPLISQDNRKLIPISSFYSHWLTTG